ncbi:MAG: hypothetical protein ACQXXH_01640 [Candidatus Bathyarchaeia archaeon]|nr:hypothetical protein [Candidatus Bathyarchaeota archaeon A05DMB-4]MDH7596070.1 hypothetical protein [Candidatus Bathyarchaeota archaeon]
MKIGKVDALFEGLRDGKWHSLNEIARKTDLDEEKTKLIIAFLEEFNFIQINTENKKIKLDALTHRFLEKIEKHETDTRYQEITA